MDESLYIWVAPLIAMITAQLLKPLLIMARIRRFDSHLMRQSGGMPSSHTALVVALVTELWLRDGGRDPVLALAMFIALIVMYDAAGVRWQTGRQAAVLNRMLKDLQGRATYIGAEQQTLEAIYVPDGLLNFTPLPVAKAPWWLMDWPTLNENVGHRPTEVVGGCVVGIVVALLLN